MKEGLFFLFLFNFIPISAQYCCTEIGKVLHYTTIDKKQEKTLKDSALVRDVIHVSLVDSYRLYIRVVDQQKISNADRTA